MTTERKPLDDERLLAALEDSRDHHTTWGGPDEARKPTPAQLRVLALSADGYTTHQSATALGLAAPTVKTHKRDACERLGAKSTTQAVAICMRHGWLG